jgi:DNA-binding protein YbaB
MQDLNSMKASLSAKADALEATARRLAEVNKRIDAMVVTERSADGAVVASVSSSGRLTALELDESVRELTPRAIAAKVLGCVQRAQGRIGDQVADLSRELLGDDLLGRHLVEDYRARFPAASPETPVPPAARPASAAEDDVEVAAMFRRPL